MAHKHGILGASSGTVQQGLAAAARALAEQESVRSWLRFPDAERDWIDRRHLEVCRVAAATFQEQARAEHLVKIFRGLGHAATLDDAGNVIVPIIFESDLPFVAVTAHLDTVLAPRQSSDIAVREDGTFEGPGVTDNGAGPRRFTLAWEGSSATPQRSTASNQRRTSCWSPMSPKRARGTSMA